MTSLYAAYHVVSALTARGSGDLSLAESHLTKCLDSCDGMIPHCSDGMCYVQLLPWVLRYTEGRARRNA
jgi:hypothetical protein